MFHIVRSTNPTRHDEISQPRVRRTFCNAIFVGSESRLRPLSTAELRGRRRQQLAINRPPRRVAMASASGQSRNVDCRSGFVNNDVEALVESRRDEIVRE